MKAVKHGQWGAENNEHFVRGCKDHLVSRELTKFKIMHTKKPGAAIVYVPKARRQLSCELGADQRVQVPATATLFQPAFSLETNQPRSMKPMSFPSRSSAFRPLDHLASNPVDKGVPLAASRSFRPIKPDSIRPTNDDVLTGVGEAYSCQHAGNQCFQDLIKARLSPFERARTGHEQDVFINEVLFMTMKKGQFLFKCTYDNRWIILSDRAVRRKIRESFNSFIEMRDGFH